MLMCLESRDEFRAPCSSVYNILRGFTLMCIALKCCLGMTAMFNFVVEVPKHSDPVKVNSNKDPGLHQNVEYCVVELKDISVP